MRIQTIEDLPSSLAAQWASLAWSDHDPALDQRLVRKARSLGVPISEYGGVLAVEGDQVLAQVLVERPRLTTPRGTESFAGISDVLTRPDALGRGLCSRLLRAVHRREKDAGARLALLWTRRTWGAHRLYEQIGYRDVYSHPTAVRTPRRSARARTSEDFTVRRASKADWATLESLLERASRARLGFVPRFRGSFRARDALGWRPVRDHHLLLRGARPVGYFHAKEEPQHVGVHEGVVLSAGFRQPLLEAMERFAGRRWLSIGYTTFVTDARDLLVERGYTLAPLSHSTLMARPLSGRASERLAELRRLVQDPRFSCHRGDMF
jgi:GNAT superfamily N-acetyltransferase